MTLKNHIINAYGEAIQRTTTKIQRLKKQAASAKCRWIFLERCVQNNVLPKSFKTRPLLKTKKAYRITNEYNIKMLQITRDATKQQYHRHLRKIKGMEAEIENKVTKEDNAIIQVITNKSKENKYNKESQRLKVKFEGLQKSDKQETKTKKKIQQEVHDMTEGMV